MKLFLSLFFFNFLFVLRSLFLPPSPSLFLLSVAPSSHRGEEGEDLCVGGKSRLYGNGMVGIDRLILWIRTTFFFFLKKKRANYCYSCSCSCPCSCSCSCWLKWVLMIDPSSLSPFDSLPSDPIRSDLV